MLFDWPVHTVFHVRGHAYVYTYLGRQETHVLPLRFWVQPAHRIGYVVPYRDIWPWSLPDHTLIPWRFQEAHLHAIKCYTYHVRAVVSVSLPPDIERLILLFLGVRRAPT